MLMISWQRRLRKSIEALTCISATVTENGSEFVKAFTSFSMEEIEHENNNKHSDDDRKVPDNEICIV